MGLAYGTPAHKHVTLADAEAAAIAKHAHYYTDVPGWLIRAEVVRYGYVVDADREEYGLTAGAIELWAFPVERYTPHGATLKGIWSGARQRWVDLRSGAKQWASRTADDAVQQLMLRRERQLYVLARRAYRAQYELDLARGVLALQGAETKETTP